MSTSPLWRALTACWPLLVMHQREPRPERPLGASMPARTRCRFTTRTSCHSLRPYPRGRLVRYPQTSLAGIGDPKALRYVSILSATSPCAKGRPDSSGWASTISSTMALHASRHGATRPQSPPPSRGVLSSIPACLTSAAAEAGNHTELVQERANPRCRPCTQVWEDICQCLFMPLFTTHFHANVG